METAILESALGLLAEGFSVIPTRREDKHPALESWKQYQEKPADEATVRGWFTGTDYNLAVVCGRVSGNLICFDFDTQAAAEAWGAKYSSLVNGAPVEVTGRPGWHVFLRTDRAVSCAKGEGYDLKGEGGYVICAPSLHANGRRYELKRGEMAKVPVIEAALLGLDDGEKDGRGKSEGWQEPLIENVPEGERHTSMVELVGRWLGKRLSAAEVLIQARAVNAGWKAPLPDAEVETIVRTLAETNAKNHPAEPVRQIKLLTVADIRKLPPVNYVIEPYGPVGAVVAFTAYTGIGKTVVSNAITLAVMSGLPFLGKYRVRVSGPVLYFDEETPQSYLKERIEKMDFRDEDPFHLAHFLGLKLDEDKDFQIIVGLVEDKKPVMVVFDTLIRFHSCDENSASEMRIVMERLRRLANMGPCIWTQIHQGKGATDIRRRSRGSSDIIGGCDLELALMEKAGGLLELRSVKSRMAPIEPVTLRIQETDGRLEVVEADDWSAEKKEALEDLLRETEGISITKMHESLTAQGITLSRRTVANRIAEMADVTYTEGPRRVRLYRIQETEG